MKKINIALFLLLITTACLFCSITDPLFFSLKLRRNVDEDVLNYYFSSDSAGQNDISDTTYALSAPFTLSNYQFYVYGITNWKSPYAIVLKFYPMTLADDYFNEYYYTAYVFTNPNNSSEYLAIHFSDGDAYQSVKFRGGNTSTYGETVTFSYPISFSFDSLRSGSYTGTIKMEIVAE